MVDLLGYYAQPGPLTEAACHHELLAALPRDAGELARVISRIGIYDVVAPDFYGIDVPAPRAGEIHLRDVDAMLAGALTLADPPLAAPRSARQRLFCRCAGFTRLFVAALRAHGVPARSRCGFATYFSPDRFEDHWVGEVWDAGLNRWRLIDAQLDEVWRDRLHLDGLLDIADIPRDRFLVAADAWTRCRTGQADPETFGISFAGLSGLWFVAANLVRDAAALNKMEMLPWDVWGAQPGPDRPLDAARLAFFDDLAALTREPDACFDELRRRYESDDRLRVPPQVFNALRERVEPVRP